MLLCAVGVASCRGIASSLVLIVVHVATWQTVLIVGELPFTETSGYTRASGVPNFSMFRFKLGLPFYTQSQRSNLFSLRYSGSFLPHVKPLTRSG